MTAPRKPVACERRCHCCGESFDHCRETYVGEGPSAEVSAMLADIPYGAIENGRAFADRLEAYPFESQGGDLRLCTEWQEFRRCFEYLAEWAVALTRVAPTSDAAMGIVRELANLQAGLENCNSGAEELTARLARRAAALVRAPTPWRQCNER